MFRSQFYKDYDNTEARKLFSIALGSTEKAIEIDRVLDFTLKVRRAKLLLSSIV